MENAPAVDHRLDLSGEAWLEEHGTLLYRYARQCVGNREAAEDLVQETLLAALKARSGFGGGSTDQTWLIGILKHKVADHLRAALRHRPMADACANDPANAFDERGRWKVRVSAWRINPHSTLEIAEFHEAFKSCLSKLPRRIARLFWLREVDGMTSEELCKELEISPTNLWTMLHRARFGLRECLGANWFHESKK